MRDASLTERSVLTTTNFIPIGRKVFVYQAAEYDVQAPAGQGRKGLSYFFGNARITPNDRVEFQASYNRGRSVDARSLSEDVLAGRAVTQQSIEGLLYESIGGRATVEVVHRVRVYAGYSRDKNNRDAEATGRTLVGAYASNVAHSGFDVTASDNLMERPQGQSYHSRYVSVGRQLGRGVLRVRRLLDVAFRHPLLAQRRHRHRDASSHHPILRQRDDQRGPLGVSPGDARADQRRHLSHVSRPLGHYLSNPMNTELSDPKNRDRRAAIEEELRRRLEHDARASAPSGAAGTVSVLTSVSLVCLQCRALSASDARFCKHCGARFNALVVAAGPSAPAATASRGGSR